MGPVARAPRGLSALELPVELSLQVARLVATARPLAFSESGGMRTRTTEAVAEGGTTEGAVDGRLPVEVGRVM